MTATRIRKLLGTTVLALGLTASLAGCPLVLLGGVAAAGAGGAMVATDRRTLGAQTEDREIQIKASARLNDQLVDTAHVNVTVFNRRVLLTGEVPNAAVRQRAEAIVLDISNVQSVVNELVLRGASSITSRSSDTFITSKVQASLIAEKDLPAHFFKVVTERGVVYLMGLVTVDEGQRGADVASRVPGVMQVVKVFQYVRVDGNEDTNANAAAIANPQPAPMGASTDADGATTGVVPSTNVTSQPLDRQPPAPISNSTTVRPGHAATPATR